jgi:hypothetical protein
LERGQGLPSPKEQPSWNEAALEVLKKIKNPEAKYFKKSPI